eukprot:scaffold1312_cov393-Prasinococcus_capsulatus_cf.AAC.3
MISGSGNKSLSRGGLHTCTLTDAPVGFLFDPLTSFLTKRLLSFTFLPLLLSLERSLTERRLLQCALTYLFFPLLTQQSRLVNAIHQTTRAQAVPCESGTYINLLASPKCPSFGRF